MKKSKDKYSTKFPWLYKTRIEALKLLCKFGHRFKKTYKDNRKFKRHFEKLLESEKFKQGLRHSGIQADKIIEMGLLKGKIDIAKYIQITDNINKAFPDIDSSASNYVYLLCDPELWENGMSFDDFLNSIFYVGRGVGARFLDHTRAAQTIIEDDVELDEKQFPKEARIIEIWSEGKPVNVVCINFDNYAEKNDFTEFAINPFLGSQLTNKKLDGITRTPEGFDVGQVCDSALNFLASAFNDRSSALSMNFDDDFGKDPDYRS